jgi:hypothetical protein
MNTNALAKQYHKLTAEERFRLILAASDRGDEGERERLAQAGGHLTVSIQDHAPYAHAFQDIGKLTYLDLLETAARYFDAFDTHRNEARDEAATDLDDEAGEYDAEEDANVPVAEGLEDDVDEVSDEDLA